MHTNARAHTHTHTGWVSCCQTSSTLAHIHPPFLLLVPASEVQVPLSPVLEDLVLHLPQLCRQSLVSPAPCNTPKNVPVRIIWTRGRLTRPLNVKYPCRQQTQRVM